MRKLKFLALSVLVLALPAVVQAQYLFTTNNGAITITGYTGPGGVVTIPSATNGYPVTSIGDRAFYHCYSLTSVTIPNSVTSIGSNAFYYCTSLTSVTIPNSVTSIGYDAFYYCDSLTSVTIPNSVTSIGEGAFDKCTSLTAINVAATNLFYSSTNGVLFNKNQTALIECPGGLVGTYIIPNSVTSIGSYAFYFCTNLTSVTIPNSVTSIGDGAFRFCFGLTSVTIPDSVTNIGYEAFYNCYSLTAINVVATNLFYSSTNGVLFNKNQTALIECPGGLVETYIIPNSVTSIGSYAFQYCTSLTSVTIGNSVTNIGSYAFYDCYRLTSVTIPNSVTSIGDSAFYYCSGLKTVCFLGNAPGAGTDSTVFSSAPATIYYLPGTTGWHSPFDGRPAFLWNPQAQTSDASFGVRTNRFGFNLTGSSNLVLVVEACTNLANPVWLPVSTNTLNTFIGTNGTSYFSDPQWTNYPGRFYRLRSP